MSTSATNRRNEERNASEEQEQQNVSNTNDAVEDDGAPVLDEIDLQENNLSEDEADNIEWDDAR